MGDGALTRNGVCRLTIRGPLDITLRHRVGRAWSRMMKKLKFLTIRRPLGLLYGIEWIELGPGW